MAHLRALGVVRYKMGEFEIDLGKAPVAPAEPTAEGSDQSLAKYEQYAAAQAERARKTMFAATSWKPRKK